MKAKKFIEKLISLYERYKEAYPPADKTEGYLFYMNGNDGTDFDYGVNNRLCEFGDFYTEGPGKGFYYIKMMVSADGSVRIYVYRGDKEQIMWHPEKFEEQVYSEKEVRYMMKYLCRNADNKLLWDREVSAIDWEADA